MSAQVSFGLIVQRRYDNSLCQKSPAPTFIARNCAQRIHQYLSYGKQQNSWVGKLRSRKGTCTVC